MDGKQNNSDNDNISSNHSVSQNIKTKRLQISMPQATKSGEVSNQLKSSNKRIGLPKPKPPSANIVTINLENVTPSPTISDIERLYERKLRNIERIKPQPQTTTLVSRFFDKNTTVTDDSDFESQTPAVIVPSPNPKQRKRTTRVVKKRIGQKCPDIRKLVNPNYGKTNENSESNSISLVQDINETSATKPIRLTLEQYGFKGGRNHEDVDISVLFGPSMNVRRKKIRPTLLMKKNVEEQQQLLAEKVSQLLMEEYNENVAVPISAQLRFETVSFFLENFIASTPEIFYKNSNGDPISDCMEIYYTASLVPVSDVKTGYLLKDWGKIPGRERSMSPKWKEKMDKTHLNTEDRYEGEIAQIEVNEEPVTISKIVNVNKNRSSVNQKDLDAVQSQLMKSNSSLNGSCEDLFADFEPNILCFTTHSSDEEEKVIFNEEKDASIVESDPLDGIPLPAHVVKPNSQKTETLSVDMTQVSSTPASCENPTPRKLSGGTLIQQIESELELLSGICNERKTSQVNNSSNGSCYIISSDSKEEIDDIEAPRKIFTEVILEKKYEELSETPSQEELEKTIIYFEPDKSFEKELVGVNFVENLVDQTILEEKSSDSMDYQELSPHIKDILASNMASYESFDEFDALVYGERKEPIPENVKFCPITVQPVKQTSLADEFDRLATMESKLAKKQELRIKTRDVTPPPDYERMDDTKIEWEMKRFGLKFIKRREDRIKILNHIYGRTHPFIEIKLEDDQNMSLLVLSGKVDEEFMEVDRIQTTQNTQRCEPMQKFMNLEEKYGLLESKDTKRKAEVCIKPVKRVKSSQANIQTIKNKPEPTISLDHFTDGDSCHPMLIQNDAYTSQLFDDTSNILAVKGKGKFQWCPLPLHIAFINVLRANLWLILKILQYEPLEVEVLYKYFKNIGARYELSDLKFFLDKHCITFRSEN